MLINFNVVISVAATYFCLIIIKLWSGLSQILHISVSAAVQQNYENKRCSITYNIPTLGRRIYRTHLQHDFPTVLKVEVFVPLWGSQQKLILLFHLHSYFSNCQHFKMVAFSRTHDICMCPKQWDVFKTRQDKTAQHQHCGNLKSAQKRNKLHTVIDVKVEWGCIKHACSPTVQGHICSLCT
jgi:hypothetical protein